MPKADDARRQIDAMINHRERFQPGAPKRIVAGLSPRDLCKALDMGPSVLITSAGRIEQWPNEVHYRGYTVMSKDA